MAYQLTILFHHKIQLRHKVRRAAIAVQNIMLCAAGAVYVPEGFACKVFYGAVVGRVSLRIIILISISLSRWVSFVEFCYALEFTLLCGAAACGAGCIGVF